MGCDNTNNISDVNIINNINNTNNESNCGCNSSQKELLNKIRGYAFSVNDLALYLDTHPCDQKALRAHKEYAEKLAEAKEMYQQKYGPLTIYYPMNNSWSWIDGPWPWERGGV